MVFECEVVAAPLLADLADDVDLDIVDVIVREHHEREEFERRAVFGIGRRVDGDATVQLGKSIGHDVDASRFSPSARDRKSSWWRRMFSATTSCGVMCVTPTSGRTS